MDPETNDDKERGRVVEAFLGACPDPTVADVKRWCRDHPRHRDAIIVTATELMEIALYAERATDTEYEPTETGPKRGAARRPTNSLNRRRDRERDREAD